MKGETHNEKSTTIREYAEEMEVTIGEHEIDEEGNTRIVIGAMNEGGHNGTDVDLLDVIEWVIGNKPEIIDELMRQKKAWNGGNKW